MDAEENFEGQSELNIPLMDPGSMYAGPTEWNHVAWSLGNEPWQCWDEAAVMTEESPRLCGGRQVGTRAGEES